MTLVKLSDVYLREFDNHKVTYVTFTDDLKLYVGYKQIKNIIVNSDNIVQKNDDISIKATVYGEDDSTLEGVRTVFLADDNVDIAYILLEISRSPLQKDESITLKAKAFDENNNPMEDVYIEFIDDSNAISTSLNKIYSIVFDDNNDAQGLRPSNVTVRLYTGHDNPQEIENCIVSENNNWIAAFTNLPKTVNDDEIYYFITVDTISNYDIDITNSVITLTSQGETVIETINVYWDDNDESEHPDSITFSANGETIVVYKSDNWTASENVPKYINGEEATYNWTSQSIASYDLMARTSENHITNFTYKKHKDVPGPF